MLLAFWIKNRLFIIACASLLLIGAVAFGIQSCREKREAQKIENLEREQTNQQIIATEQGAIANVKKEDKKEIESNVQDIQQQTNTAKENFNKSVRKDSSTFDSSGAEDKFCYRFPCDSTCFEWHKKHPEVDCD